MSLDRLCTSPVCSCCNPNNIKDSVAVEECKPMTDEEFDKWECLEYRMEAEGFNYCFEHYSRWDEIKDEEFHDLRKQYLEAMNKLRTYIEKVIEDELKNR